MINDIDSEIIFNIIKDWEKKHVSAEAKSKFLKSVLLKEGLSQRELAKKLNISHSTLHDWVSMRQVNNGIKNYGIKTLIDRLLFVLTKKPLDYDDKTIKLLKDLKNELERLKI